MLNLPLVSLRKFLELSGFSLFIHKVGLAVSVSSLRSHKLMGVIEPQTEAAGHQGCFVFIVSFVLEGSFE